MLRWQVLIGFMDTSVGILGQRVLKPNGLPSVEGMYGSMPFLWWTEVSNPGIQFVNQQFTANERGPGRTEHRLSAILGRCGYDHRNHRPYGKRRRQSGGGHGGRYTRYR